MHTADPNSLIVISPTLLIEENKKQKMYAAEKSKPCRHEQNANNYLTHTHTYTHTHTLDLS